MTLSIKLRSFLKVPHLTLTEILMFIYICKHHTFVSYWDYIIWYRKIVRERSLNNPLCSKEVLDKTFVSLFNQEIEQCYTTPMADSNFLSSYWKSKIYTFPTKIFKKTIHPCWKLHFEKNALKSPDNGSLTRVKDYFVPRHDDQFLMGTSFQVEW